MNDWDIQKKLTRNDLGLTGSHQSGIAVPKKIVDMGYFPELDSKKKNPDCWIEIQTDHRAYYWRYIHYNNKLTTPGGTRDEFRLTHTKEFLMDYKASEKDILVIKLISKSSERSDYKMECWINKHEEKNTDYNDGLVIDLSWKINH